ncbi:hypothetical protein M3J09_012894 [Ascochyta lentis]
MAWALVPPPRVGSEYTLTRTPRLSTPGVVCQHTETSANRARYQGLRTTMWEIVHLPHAVPEHVRKVRLQTRYRHGQGQQS